MVISLLKADSHINLRTCARLSRLVAVIAVLVVSLASAPVHAQDHGPLNVIGQTFTGLTFGVVGGLVLGGSFAMPAGAPGALVGGPLGATLGSSLGVGLVGESPATFGELWGGSLAGGLTGALLGAGVGVTQEDLGLTLYGLAIGMGLGSTAGAIVAFHWDCDDSAGASALPPPTSPQVFVAPATFEDGGGLSLAIQW